MPLSIIPPYRVWLALFLACFLSGMLVTVGCSCRTDDQAEIEKKKKEEDEKKKKKKGKSEKPQEPFEVKDVRTTPSDSVSGLARQSIKPGHWVQTTAVIVSNKENFNGELHSATVDDTRPLFVDHTSYHLRSNRPATLPKGQPRPFETLVYVPRRFEKTDAFTDTTPTKSISLEWKLTHPGNGGEVLGKREPTSRMAEYQFFLVLLSQNPSAYSYLVSLDSIAPPTPTLGGSSDNLMPYFRIVAPRPNKTIPLPEAALMWTSISTLIWDDIDPAALSVNQQEAMLDWLHWGGQLVVSGPRTLDRLRSSFLAPYLPATAGESISLDSEEFEALNDYWGLAPKNAAKVGKGMWKLSTLPDKPMLGVELKLAGDGQFVPHCGKLVAERWVGRGRIAVAAFPLSDGRLITWRNLDNFINGALLRRPGRIYKAGEFQELQLTWQKYPGDFTDPRLISTLRYFSRDAGGAPTELAEKSSENQPLRMRNPEVRQITRTANLDKFGDPWHFGGFEETRESGVAGWNDFTSASKAAGKILEDAAKIKIPKADFVLKMIGVYLLVLVPVNWLIFRAIGRVEWAWIAAPFIAIAAAGAVIRMAQLDIGFVRSRTDIAVIELQGNYSRGHVTRYTALYTSLASDYDFVFDDPYALCLPLAKEEGFQHNALLHTPLPVTFRREEKSTMRGFRVQSSSTAWTHSEQMLSVGGLAWTGDDATGWKLKNNTAWKLRDLGVLRRSQAGNLEVAWIAELNPAASVAIRFGEVDEDRIVGAWKSSLVMSRTDEEIAAARDKKLPAVQDNDSPTAGEVRLWRLVDLATNQLKLANGDVRLVAWTDEPLPGMTIVPASAQFTSRSLILAHLHRGDWGSPERDSNTRVDVVNTSDAEGDQRPKRDLGKDDEPPPMKNPDSNEPRENTDNPSANDPS